MRTTPLYIFDLDGTLADIRHRRHFVTRSDDPTRLRRKPDWGAFHAACVNDTPIQPVIDTLHILHCSDVDVWIWSGRMDTVRTETQDWVMKHVGLGFGPWFQLKMRPANDYIPDDQLKESWLHAMDPEDRARLVMVFDDRQRVVDMWRRNGVVCAQIAPGNF